MLFPLNEEMTKLAAAINYSKKKKIIRRNMTKYVSSDRMGDHVDAVIWVKSFF
jgi:hypothetical protein